MVINTISPGDKETIHDIVDAFATIRNHSEILVILCRVFSKNITEDHVEYLDSVLGELATDRNSLTTNTINSWQRLN
jgi:hypothetical protein